jgi:hypothetical protein
MYSSTYIPSLFSYIPDVYNPTPTRRAIPCINTIPFPSVVEKKKGRKGRKDEDKITRKKKKKKPNHYSI